MKTFKIITIEEVKTGDLLVLDNNRLFYARENNSDQELNSVVSKKANYGRRVRENSGDEISCKVQNYKKINWRTLNKIKAMKAKGLTSMVIATDLNLPLEEVNKRYANL